MAEGNKASVGLNEGGQTTFNRATDAQVELERLEALIAELKTKYEQFFMGILALPPEKLYSDVKRRIREIRKFPFKNSRVRFKLVALDRRFQSYDTYWQRVIREKEAGTYFRDLFKADLRDRFEQEDTRATTEKGATEKYVQGLFHSYSEALERASGKRQDISYDRFKEELIKRAKILKEQAQGKKVTFRVVDKGGRVTLEARVADKEG